MIWTWWMTLAAVALVAVLIACIPVGVDARYDAGAIFLTIRIWFLRIQILPQKQKKKTQQTKKARSAAKPAADKPADKKQSNAPLSGGVDGIMQLLNLAWETLGDLRHKIRVNELTLYVCIGGSDDPAKAAMHYGRAWAAIGMLTPALERLFVIKKRDIRPALDYNKRNMQVEAHLVTSITIGRALALALRAGFRFLNLMHERKKAV